MSIISQRKGRAMPKAPFELPPWQVVCCPGTVRFERIAKDTHTLARIYALHREFEGIVWLGQSMTSLMEAIGKHYDLHMHVSSGYRVIRQELKSGMHRGFLVARLADESEVNALLERLCPFCLAVVVRHPDRWEIAKERDDAPARDSLPRA